MFGNIGVRATSSHQRGVKGHHPLAKKAFEGAVGYDYKEAFSISKKVLDNISGITTVALIFNFLL